MKNPLARRINELFPRGGGIVVSKRNNGTYKFYRGFFYRGNGSSDIFADRITKKLISDPELAGYNFIVLDKGEVWKPFRGGASVRNQSHWYVTIKAEV